MVRTPDTFDASQGCVMKMKPLFMFAVRDIHNLEFDAETQYRFHRLWAIFWFATMLVVPFFHTLRTSIPALLILEASLWANFATHFGGMSAALAAKTSKEAAA